VPSNPALFGAYFIQRKAFNVPSNPALFSAYFIQRKAFNLHLNLAFAQTELIIKSICHASRRCYIALSISGSFSLRRSLLRNCSWERTPKFVKFRKKRWQGSRRACMLCKKRGIFRRIATRLFARIFWSTPENSMEAERRKRPHLSCNSHGAKRIISKCRVSLFASSSREYFSLAAHRFQEQDLPRDAHPEGLPPHLAGLVADVVLRQRSDKALGTLNKGRQPGLRLKFQGRQQKARAEESTPVERKQKHLNRPAGLEVGILRSETICLLLIGLAFHKCAFLEFIKEIPLTVDRATTSMGAFA
jgi:hypothetical protein